MSSLNDLSDAVVGSFATVSEFDSIGGSGVGRTSSSLPPANDLWNASDVVELSDDKTETLNDAFDIVSNSNGNDPMDGRRMSADSTGSRGRPEV